MQGHSQTNNPQNELWIMLINREVGHGQWRRMSSASWLQRTLEVLSRGVMVEFLMTGLFEYHRETAMQRR
jgi:hypothetical protein